MRSRIFRVPFIAEGVIQGLLGSALAALAVRLLGGAFLPDRKAIAAPTLLESIRWTSDQLRWTVIVVLLIGPIVGALSSFISVSWYLRSSSSN